MSLEALSLIYKVGLGNRLTNVEALVYTLIAKCADKDSLTCYPSEDYIAKAFGKDKSTISKAISSLIRKGFVERIGRERHAWKYRLSLSWTGDDDILREALNTKDAESTRKLRALDRAS